MAPGLAAAMILGLLVAGVPLLLACLVGGPLPAHKVKWLYASEWGERVRSRGGDGPSGQLTPPAWRSTRRR